MIIRATRPRIRVPEVDWLSQIHVNMLGGVDPQAINSTFFNKNPNPIVVHCDAGVVVGVEANFVVPHPALLFAHCCNRLHNMSDITSGAVVLLSIVGCPGYITYQTLEEIWACSPPLF